VVLLLLTDGDIKDSKSADKALTLAANLPLSVILVQTLTSTNKVSDEKVRHLGKGKQSNDSGHQTHEKMLSPHKKLGPSRQPAEAGQPPLLPDGAGLAATGKDPKQASADGGQPRTDPSAPQKQFVEMPGRTVYHFIKYEEKPDESRIDPAKGYLNSIPDLSLAEEVFRFIPKQFLEYMTRANIAPQKSSDSKTKSAKKEIKEKMAKKKSLSSTPEHPIVAHLRNLKESFKDSIKRAGYDEGLRDSIFSEGIAASDFNLFAEIISEKQNLNLQLEQKPVDAPQQHSEAVSAPLGSSANLTHTKISFNQLESLERLPQQDRAGRKADPSRLEPTVSKLYTKDKIPEKRFKQW